MPRWEHPAASECVRIRPACHSRAPRSALGTPELALDTDSIRSALHSPDLSLPAGCAPVRKAPADIRGGKPQIYICRSSVTLRTADPCNFEMMRRSERSCGLVVHRNSAPSW